MQEQKKNYQKNWKKLKKLGRKSRFRPLPFTAAAPCSSYVMEYLSDYFRIAVFYFNPNITEEAEYEAGRRAETSD